MDKFDDAIIVRMGGRDIERIGTAAINRVDKEANTVYFSSDLPKGIKVGDTIIIHKRK